ncbi:hypothetical protein Emed_004463 [Eimeria media]
MWYAESIFVRCGENPNAVTAAKLSTAAKVTETAVVVDRPSGATQGSFWSLAAGSDNAEISERTRYQRAKITLLPLRFRDKEAEEEFVFNSSRLWVWRNVCLFVFKIVATTCVYAVTTAIGAFTGKSYVPDVFFKAVASLLLPIIPVVKQRLEYATYALLITEALVLAIFLVYEKANAYSALPNSFNIHLWTQPAERSTGDTLLLRILHAFILVASAIAGAYASETKRRGLFFAWLTMKRQVKVLERERDKATDSNLRSGVSALQSHCKQVEVALMGAKTAHRGTNIYSQVEEAAFHINACLDIMTNSKDLYHAELHEELQEKTFIKAINMKKANGNGLLAANAGAAARDNVVNAKGYASDREKSGPFTLTAFYNNVAADSEDLSRGVRIPRFLDEIEARVGSDLGFDLLSVQTTEPCHSAFFECGYALLRRHTDDWGCDDCVLRVFLVEIEGLYNDNPYHNSTHGAMVAHLMDLFCRSIELDSQLNSLGLTAVLLAALCHDVGHPGRNNAFFAADRSPLEVMEIRSNIITLILATDMKTHFSALSRLRASRQNASFDHRKQRDDTWLVVEMCMRAADIGHGIVAWDHHFEWSCRITAEFYLQGDEEQRLKRGVSPLCDRDLHNSMARSQVGFLAHIVKPLFTELNSAECMKGAFQESLDAIEANISEWQRLHDSRTEVVFPPTVASCEEALRGVDHTLDVSLVTETRVEGLGG